MKEYIKKTFGVDDLGAKNLIIACVASFFSTIAILLTNVGLFIFLSDIIVPILEKKEVSLNIIKFIPILITLSLILIISGYIKYMRAYIPVYAAAAKKKLGIAERLRKLPLSFFGRKDIADITTTILQDSNALEDAFSAYIPTLFSAVLSTLIMCIAIFIYNPILGIAVFWSVPIAFVLAFLSKKMQQAAGKKKKAVVLGYLDSLQQCVENIKDIKSNNREEYHKSVLYGSFKRLEDTMIAAEFKLGTMLTVIQMLIKVGMASTALVSVNMLLSDKIAGLEFLVYLTISTRIYDPLLSALTNMSALYQAIISIDRTREFENIAIQVGKTNPNYKGYDIEFKDVKFSYEGSNKEGKETVVDGLSFIAKQGEITALVGPSGGGKSTALKLAARFWDVKEGQITLGGEDISQIDPEVLLESISIVFQDVILFNNTVMENIRLGRKGATDEEVILAAKNARCHDFIMAMPNGYNTMIGENGSKISGGERQRISIARALLKDAPVVLLDEATSSLDIKNETAVQDAIANLTRNKTVIIIAHRMRTIMGADKIMVLKDGKLNQVGNHVELINQEGEYKKMVNLQMNSAKWQL